MVPSSLSQTSHPSHTRSKGRLYLRLCCLGVHYHDEQGLAIVFRKQRLHFLILEANKGRRGFTFLNFY